MKSKILRLLAAAVMVFLLTTPLARWPDPGGAPAPIVDDAVRVERASDAPTTEPDLYIVLLEGASLSSYAGGIPGLDATNPATRGETKLDAKSPASVAYLDYLAGQHAQFIDRMEQALGRSVDVLYRYDAVLNGLAVRLSAREAKVAAGLPGVLRWSVISCGSLTPTPAGLDRRAGHLGWQRHRHGEHGRGSDHRHDRHRHQRRPSVLCRRGRRWVRPHQSARRRQLPWLVRRRHLYLQRQADRRVRHDDGQ